MFYGLCHVGIYCIDREESIAFYREHLGFSLDFCVEVQAGNGFLKIACLRQNNFTLELLQLVDSSQVKKEAEQTWNHFAVYVKDIKKAITDLEATGRVVFEPGGILNVPGFGKEDVKAAFFRGINGERIELIEAVYNA